MLPTMSYNEEKRGIEISFPYVPSRSIRKELHSFGFKYHRERNIWYAKQTEERDKFARNLCGEKELTEEKETEKKLYRYYSRRPVDIGTFPKRDIEPVNIVNYDSRIPVEDGSFTAWGYIEYESPLKEKDINQYELTPAPDSIEEYVVSENSSLIRSSVNTFAANYDSVGDTPILETADFDLYKHREAYIRDLNISYRRLNDGDGIYVTELENAGKNGKNCTEFAIYRRGYSGKDPIAMKLINDFGISSVSELYKSLQEEKDFGFDVQIERRDRKGVETFSPFIEIKPLAKIPERWNKRNFTNAMLSGQIYGGQIEQRLTDDYRYDAGQNFSEGVPVDIVKSARDTVENWSSLAIVSTGGIESSSKCNIDFYDGYSTSKTYYFDLSCDICEGKRREEERLAGVKDFNDMMASLCLKPSAELIDPGKVYSVTSLDRYTNSGIYGTVTEILQGHVLKDRLSPESIHDDILEINEMEIIPEQIYSIANSNNRREGSAADDRIIECGNWLQIVTGKGLLEMTLEGIYFPVISEGTHDYADYITARNTLSKLADGSSMYVAHGSSIDFAHSLECLDNEYVRAGGKRSLGNIIQDAQQRTTSDSPEHISNFSHDR